VLVAHISPVADAFLALSFSILDGRKLSATFLCSWAHSGNWAYPFSTFLKVNLGGRLGDRSWRGRHGRDEKSDEILGKHGVVLTLSRDGLEFVVLLVLGLVF
jgi:hypothetical protein